MLRKGEDAGLHMLHNAGKGGVWAQEQVQAYCGGVQDIVDAAGDKQFFEHLGTYIYDFFRLAYTHEVKLDHNFVCVAMAVKVMEGLAISLNPSLDLIKAAIPYVMSSKIAATTKGLRAAGALTFTPAPVWPRCADARVLLQGCTTCLSRGATTSGRPRRTLRSTKLAPTSPRRSSTPCARMLLALSPLQWLTLLECDRSCFGSRSKKSSTRLGVARLTRRKKRRKRKPVGSIGLSDEQSIRL